VDWIQQLKECPANGNPEASRTDATMSIPLFPLVEVETKTTEETLLETYKIEIRNMNTKNNHEITNKSQKF
jgi:hypothetical protein